MTVKQLLDAYVSDYSGPYDADLLARLVLATRKGELESDVECAQNVDALRSKALLVASKIVRTNDRVAADKRETAQRQQRYEADKAERKATALASVLATAKPITSSSCDAKSFSGGYGTRCMKNAKHNVIVDTPTGISANLCMTHVKSLADGRVSLVRAVYDKISAEHARVETENAQIEADRAAAAAKAEFDAAEAEANAKGYSLML